MTKHSQFSSKETMVIKQKEEKKIEDNEKNEKKRGKFDANLFEELSPLSTFGCFVLPLVTIKDMILPFMLIFFIKNPIIQLLSLIIFSLFFLVFLSIFRPYKSILDNTIQIFNNFMYTLSSTLFLVLYLLKDSISEENRHFILGNLIILVLSAIIIVNVGLGIVIGCHTTY